MAERHNETRNECLTPKQERFVILIVYGHEGKFLTQAGAYRLSYNCEKSSETVVWREACRLMSNHKVATRIAQLRNAMAVERGISVETETEKLDINWRLATYGDMTVERDQDGNVS